MIWYGIVEQFWTGDSAKRIRLEIPYKPEPRCLKDAYDRFAEFVFTDPKQAKEYWDRAMAGKLWCHFGTDYIFITDKERAAEVYILATTPQKAAFLYAEYMFEVRVLS